MSKMMVFTGNANPALAQKVVERLDIPLGKANVSRFSDGEVSVEIQENVRGKDVFIIQSTCAPTNSSIGPSWIGRTRHSTSSVALVAEHYPRAGQTSVVASSFDV